MSNPIIKVKADLFKDIKFSLCEDVYQYEQVKKLLLDGGAQFVHYLLDNVNYFIADNPDHPKVSEACEIYEKPVVTSRWVWLCAKTSTILPITGFLPFRNQLFSNLTVCPSNITGPDMQSLWAMVTFYGGEFQLELDSKCTHLISIKPEGAKYMKALETNDKIKIVTPDWIIDSVKSKTLCDEDLYHPRLLIFSSPESKSDNINNASSASLVVTTSLQPISVSALNQQVTLKTVSIPSSTIISTIPLTQPYSTQAIPSQGGRVRVFLPPQHQVRLMQMQKPRAQVVNVQQIVHRTPNSSQQQQPQQQVQQQQQQQQQQINVSAEQWNASQQQAFITTIAPTLQTQTGTIVRTTANAIVQQAGQQQQSLAQQGPRQVYLAVQQQQHIRQQQLVQLRQQFISVQQSQQARPQSNIVIQQRQQMPISINGQPVRLQQGQTQQLIQLQQRQPVTIQGQPFLRGTQQIIIQQQNQQGLPRQIQIQQQGIPQQNFPAQNSGQPQVQQRIQMTQPRMQQQTQQFQQTQLQRSPIRVSTTQQIVSTTMPTCQPRVYMKASPQYPPQVQNSQQFDQQQQGQILRNQFPPQTQMQFIRGPQWAQTTADGQTQIRPQQIIVATQQQGPQQLMNIQWQQQQQQQQPQQQQQQQQQQPQQLQQLQQLQQMQQPQQLQNLPRRQLIPPRFQQTTQQEKVRPTVSIVSVSSGENIDAQPSGAAAPIRLAQKPAPTPANNHQAQTNVVSTPNTQTSQNASSSSPVVNPKTKTALANLLNNRLQSGTVGTNKGDGGNSNDGVFVNSSGASLPLSSTSCSSVTNKTGFIGSPGVVLPSSEIMQALRQDEQLNQNLAQQVRFYGFDSKIDIPSDLFLLDCIFYIVDYEKDFAPLNYEKLKKAIIKFGGQLEDTYSSKCTHVLCENQANSIVQQALKDNKRCVGIFWFNDIFELKKMVPPWRGIHFPCAFNDDTKPCKNHIISITSFSEDERHIVRNMIIRTGAKFTTYFTKTNTILICKKLEGKKYEKAIEWRIPIVNVQWLIEVLLGHFDVLQFSCISKKFQQFDFKDPFKLDYNSVQNLMSAWKIPIKVSEETIKTKIEELEKKKIEKTNKMEVSQTNDEINHEESNGDIFEPPIKQQKLNEKNLTKNIYSLPPSPGVSQIPIANPEFSRLYRILITGSNERDQLNSIIVSLGGKITNVPNDCTHLVTNKITRTVKFLCAFNYCKFVVSTTWIFESGKHGKFLNEQDFILNDPDGESQFQFNLSKSLQRRNSPIFKNYVFYLTSGCIPSPNILKEIIESAGGIPVLKKSPTDNQLENMLKNGQKFVVITCNNDLHLCNKFFEKKIPVLNVEFILTGILRQEINYELYTIKKYE